MPSSSEYNIRIYSKVEDYKTENKTHIDTQMTDRKWWQPRLQLHLVTLNCMTDENWVCSSSSENDAAYEVPIYVNFL